MKTKFKLIFVALLIFCITQSVFACENQCFSGRNDDNCPNNPEGHQSYTLHMSVHPHLDAFWIFNLDSYYDPKPQQGDVLSYFRSNRFNSVKQIFDTTTRVLSQSKEHRQLHGKGSQKAHRSFFNSQMGFFKKWYTQQTPQRKQQVKSLLKTKYWQIVGGGFVEHDQGCAYYDDIIQNFQTGLNFLKNQFNYSPKAAISADSFGHSQTTLAILAHLGIQGFFVERSDQHILLQNKTQFIWKAKSANGQYYGALPTHIRWAIHGFEDQFIGGGNQNLCASKENYINNMRRQNQFLKRILHSPHIMRYFGHDFQQFDDYSYNVIEAIMQKFSSQKCNRVVAVYGNPTQYFLTLMGEVFGKKKKPIAVRQQDIFPIWDYDSGLYWTGYYTTDPYHKKNYRDTGRFLYGVRKFMLPSYSKQGATQALASQYETLQILAQQVSYLQHHDGISGTSKYTVMDELQTQNEQLMQKIKQSTLKRLFEEQFDSAEGQKNEYCIFGTDCRITSDQYPQINLKIFNSAGYQRHNQPFIIQLPYDSYYVPNCPYEINCLCQQIPCQCSLYLYPQNYGAYVTIKLKKSQVYDPISKFKQLKENSGDKMFSFNSTHFKIQLQGKHYAIGYKKVIAEGTPRNYAHLSRYGDQYERGFHINSGKYALGNDPNKISDFTQINKVLKLESSRNIIILIKWNRQGMKTLITIDKAQLNQWKVQTHSAAEAYHLQDLYLEVQTSIKNENKFYTDSNGWLVMKRQLFYHEDYKAHFDPHKLDDIDGNSYPMTAFTFIEDSQDKVSINTDRPQGVIAYRPGTLWVNFDRLTSDDGKWVYQTTYRSDYQRFTHVITVQNKNFNQRKIQALYDMPILSQISYSQPTQPLQKTDTAGLLRQWSQYSGLTNLKTTIKPINDSTVVVRVHNLNDKQVKKVKLFVGDVSPLLTAFYGSLAKITKVEERSLGNNMHYKEFVQTKWNWHQVVDLQKQNSIFNKQFGQTITLRPLEIRTFLFHGLRFVEGCDSPSKLYELGKTVKYELNTQRPAPKRQEPLWQQDVINYLLKQNHCNVKSPIIIDKKYPNQNPSSDVNHTLRNINNDDYKILTHLEDSVKIKIEQQNAKREKAAQQKAAQQKAEKQKVRKEKIQKLRAEREKEQKQKSERQKTKPILPQKRQPKQIKIVHENIMPGLSQQDTNKLKFIQIREKIQNLKPLTRQQKQIYFGIRLNQVRDILKSQQVNKNVKI